MNLILIWGEIMTVKELIKKLEEYADKYGDNIPVCTFDLNRDICDIDDVDVYDVHGKAYYIYIG